MIPLLCYAVAVLAFVTALQAWRRRGEGYRAYYVASALVAAALGLLVFGIGCMFAVGVAR